jgi:dTDP-3-amino-2,3,6-trideoxy-4-keto-D-glucose/dTDP-3-amino-3,4,6-trideoxy-alpha-D-glucose/dTDP-2,6-dideoxy-D-kanosamine transaminase
MLINSLNLHIANHRAAIDMAIKRVLDRSWLVLGPEVVRFENSFAEYMQVSYCTSVANGTDALELALRALGIKPEDKIATVANAGMYTTTAILSIGALPVFMDVDSASLLVTKDEIDRVLAIGVKAVVVTHLYGQAQVAVAEIAEKCRAVGIAMVEDCAQAHGARINGRPVGSFGNVSCFSFYPTKNLGALGDGGAVLCNDGLLSERVRQLRQYGWGDKYQVELFGARNSRLDEIQAAILSEFLPHLDNWNKRRREIATQYSKRIINPRITIPPVGGEDYVSHLYVVRCLDREKLRLYLQHLDICTDIHYPIPDHHQPVFKGRFSAISLPITEKIANEVITLPCYPEMTLDDVNCVVSAVNDWED